MKKNFIFVGMLLACLFCGTSAVLAKEDRTEECDAALKEVLDQAREINASAAFLQEIMPTLNDTKKVIEELVVEQGVGGGTTSLAEQEYEKSLQQYRDSVNRYFGRNSQPKK